MKTAGIPAQTEKKETEEYIECTVRIPQIKQSTSLTHSLIHFPQGGGRPAGDCRTALSFLRGFIPPE